MSVSISEKPLLEPGQAQESETFRKGLLRCILTAQMRSVRIPACAKVNLCLQVVGRRADGYHDLRTVFQTLSLHDTLEISLHAGPGIELTCSDASLPIGKDNLVWRAADALRRELRLRRGIRVQLTKRVPVAGGLGGGSSDAAATLIGLLRLSGQRLALSRLSEIAAELGADVPVFLFGGRALGVGRGDQIFPLPDGARRAVVVVSPRDIGVSTQEAFRWLGRKLTKPAADSKLWSFCALCWSPQEAPLENDFEEAVFQRHPRLARIKRTLLQAGAAGAALAGSGSAVFGLFRNPAQARRTAQMFSGNRVFVCRTLSREEYRHALWGRGGFARSLVDGR